MQQIAVFDFPCIDSAAAFEVHQNCLKVAAEKLRLCVVSADAAHHGFDFHWEPISMRRKHRMHGLGALVTAERPTPLNIEMRHAFEKGTNLRIGLNNASPLRLSILKLPSNEPEEPTNRSLSNDRVVSVRPLRRLNNQRRSSPPSPLRPRRRNMV